MRLVVRAMGVLRAVAAADDGLTLQELQSGLDIPAASLNRLLAAMESELFITRSPLNHRYFLGPAACHLAGDSAPARARLIAPHPAVTELAEKTGETVFLTELFGDRAVCTALIERTRPLMLFVNVGQELPFHAAAAARVLLAYEDEYTARRVLESRSLTLFTSRTPPSVEATLEHLELVRARGYDMCDNELDRGVRTAAAPVRMSTGRVTTSVTLAVPARQTDPCAEELRDLVVVTAARMSAELGYAEPGAGPR
ncbi:MULTISPECIES: IclR family transcriptional regulator [unclassified Streptomyces]|uniref:IclR family transcriptional regulator n=1 Tax=unclassified Streptomyces TaxID=2593676 RepID=UPI00225AAEA3|nr:MULTISPECIES: IclR family transcriptional regulator [unclassified Streptomyces]MCX4628628.1 IclR family transcriptional regulator [Streptomyces sp. NBC_01443]